MFYAKKFLPKILVASLFLAIVVVGIFWNKPPKANAEANLPVIGYAWSDIIGWINFNPAFGGVSYNNTTGQLSGYAWSEHIGWVYFGPDKSNISASMAPNDPKQWAKANTTTGIVNGWAKTYRAIPDKTDINAEDGQALGGWEGWIKMDHGMTNPVSIDFATGDFHGWAWSSDTAGIIGWISFNSKDCDLDNNGFIDIACGGKNNNTTPAYPYKVTIGISNTPTYTIEPASVSVSVGGTQRFIGYYDSDGSGSAVKIDKTLEALSWTSNNALVSTIATSTGQAIANCLTAGTVAITSVYNNIPASASLTCTPVGGSSSSNSSTGGGGGGGGGGGSSSSSSSSTGGGGSSSSSITGGVITITPPVSTIKAVIIEGLPANSEMTNLSITSTGGCGNVTLSANYTDLTANGNFNFIPVSVVSGGTSKFSVKNIPGSTEAKTYPIKITGTGSSDSCTGTAIVNLKVEKIGSDWEEF